MKKFNEKIYDLKSKYKNLIEQKNKVDENWYNGIYDRYVNPVLTNEHIPLEWRYDLNEERNPYLMERIGVNAVFNSGAIYLDGKYVLVARVEGYDRKSFFAVARSDNGVDNFVFDKYPVRLPKYGEDDTNVYDMRLTQHEDGWIYGLFSDKEGNFIKKPMRECTGKEICMEWLYHLGVPESEIETLAENSANTVPCMMPYITAFFMPRTKGDRPDVVPAGAVNFAFLGQFAETERDTIFTTEYSIRTGMEAVYTLLDVDRGVPEVWGSVYDVRDLLNATVQLRDGKKLTELNPHLLEKLALKALLRKVENTEIEKLLKEYNVI